MRKQSKSRRVRRLLSTLGFAAAMAVVPLSGRAAAVPETAKLSGAAEVDPMTQAIPEFLQHLRRPVGSDTWGTFDGELMHRRSGGELEKIPFYFSVNIQKQRMIGQIVFDGREGYYIGQSFVNGAGTVSPMRRGGYGKTAMMSRFGVAPSDLTMSFLHYPFQAEEGNEIFRLLKCRKLRFTVPPAGGGGSVLVWVTKYYMPVKAEFFRAGEKTPSRTLEIDSFGNRNQLYYAETLNIYGPGWRTKILFRQAELGEVGKGNMPDIYRKISSSAQ